MSDVVISSGHGKYVAGASSILIEVDEARRVVDRTAEILQELGVDVEVVHDNQSHSQSDNLDYLVDEHNRRSRKADMSVHFNSFDPGTSDGKTDNPMGVECLYVTQSGLAEDMAQAIAAAGGLINRGGKYRDNLAFLNGTSEPAVLVEVCFVNSRADADRYEKKFDAICRAIAKTIAPFVQPVTS